MPTRRAKTHASFPYSGSAADPGLGAGDAERLYHSVVEVLSEGVAVIAADTTIIVLNASAERILGVRAGDVLGRRLLDWPWRTHLEDGSVLPREDHPALVSLRSGLTQSDIVLRVERGDGSGERVWVSVSSRPLTHPGAPMPYAVVASFRDVSEGKRAEERLREGEEQYRTVVQTVRDVIFRADWDGRFTMLNPAWEEITGFPVTESLGRSFLDYVHPEDRKAHLEEFLPLVRGQSAYIRHEVRYLTSGGENRWIEMHARAVSDANGGLVGVTGVLHDVTERRELERMKSEFVSTVSHELRTPLTSIRGSLGLLEAGAVGTIGDKARELVRIARSNADRLIRLITDVLDLEKMEARRLEFVMARISAAELVRHAVEGVHGLEAQYGVTVIAHASCEVDVWGDHDRLLQVLTNFLSNALKFSPRNATVGIRATQADGAVVRFSVEDRGPGIPEEKLGLLFQKFRMLDGTDSRRRGGTGLGLAITKAIVEQHRGRVGVDSQPGIRTAFWCEIPVAESMHG
jgi:PAS domain S-box-containing protein